MATVTHGDARRTQIMAEALKSAERGHPVFPVCGKVPLTERGFKDGSTDQARITAMFNAAPNATGYGIATSATRPVLDIDGPEGRAEAERRGLTSGYVVKSGRAGGGWHVYLTNPSGVELRTGDIAPGIRLQADGVYVVGPGSRHPSGRLYKTVKDGEPSPMPKWVLEAAQKRDEKVSNGNNSSPITVDVAGPAIPEGGRNDTLTRIAGRLHDGSRDLEQLIADLLAVNDARCEPPLPEREVRRVAASIYRREPCRASLTPKATPEVLATVEYLASVERPVKGMGGATGWSLYSAALELARRFGAEHRHGVAISVDLRTWAQVAGVGSTATVSKFVKRCPLIKLLKRGTGRQSSRFLLVAPIGVQTVHSNHSGGTLEDTDNCSEHPRPLLRTLYRLRWGPGRIGKSRAALLTAILEYPGACRFELAKTLGRKPESLKKPLAWLIDAGLVARVGRGRYALADNFAERVEEARELGREPEADRLQIARHSRARAAYRNPRRSQAERAPTEEAMREVRESYPERRHAAIVAAIARLFADHPEYRARRTGKVTCALIDYLPLDFPRGQDGAPKDAEVEAVLEGEEATSA